MSNKSLIILAKVMIFCSVILIGSGVYLNLQETKPIIDPVSGVTTPDDDSVIITTDDGMPPATTNDNDDSDPSKTDNTTNTTVVPNDSTSSGTTVPNNTTTSGNAGSTGNTGNTSGTNTNPTPSPAPEPEPEPAPAVDQNVVFRKSIEDTYGVKVFYGNETSGYSVGGMSTTVIPDSSVSSALTQLNTALSTYPVGFFQEFLNKNINVNVYLIKNYSANNVTGVTDTSFKRINISIAMDFPFDESFHHEVLHAIEYYIERSGGKFTSWNSFNPADFSYGSENKDYSYSVTGNASSYFVNNYAQVSQSEDRASTFEYMTASKRYSCFDSHGYPIWQKSDYLSRMIDTYFNTVTPEVIDYWERYVY